MIVAKYGHDKRRYASLAQEVTKVKRLRVGIKKRSVPLKRSAYYITTTMKSRYYLGTTTILQPALFCRLNYNLSGTKSLHLCIIFLFAV